MTWHLTADVEEFAKTADRFLRSRPVQHTVLLTLVDKLRRQGLHLYGPDDPIFGWWQPPGGEVGGAFLQTPPHPMVFSDIPPEAGPAAVAALAGRPLPAANLVAGAAEEFAARWPRPSTVRGRMRLYRLDQLTPAPAPPGSARPAGTDDRDLLLRWTAGFHNDIGEPDADIAGQVDDLLSAGGLTLWESAGEPVSMAGRSRPAAGMVRILNVYTPPEQRGRGYGGAATVAATRAALADGVRDVVLFTDLANPTSNGLYQRLGYRPIEDRVVVEFS
ncbi:MAG: GNAT family N-acetyltransferase [Actinoplanes sp.]